MFDIMKSFMFDIFIAAFFCSISNFKESTLANVAFTCIHFISPVNADIFLVTNSGWSLSCSCLIPTSPATALERICVPLVSRVK